MGIINGEEGTGAVLNAARVVANRGSPVTGSSGRMPLLGIIVHHELQHAVISLRPFPHVPGLNIESV